MLAPYSLTTADMLSPLHVPSPPNATTYIKAVNEIRSKIKKASGRSVDIFAINVRPEQLKSAYDLLDKAEGRRAMRVTYSDDHNFIVRYMPGRVHEVTYTYGMTALVSALVQLTPLHNEPMPLGCITTGSTTFQLGPRQKQPDASIGPTADEYPSIIFEVGDSESLTQLRIDARLWLEHVPEVQLVILLSINPPIPPLPNFPRITIQLWRGFPPHHPPHAQAARQRQACMVWEADWTEAATPFYILLFDIFKGLAPAEYGNNDRVQLNSVAWRQAIINSFRV